MGGAFGAGVFDTERATIDGLRVVGSETRPDMIGLLLHDSRRYALVNSSFVGLGTGIEVRGSESAAPIRGNNLWANDCALDYATVVTNSARYVRNFWGEAGSASEPDLSCDPEAAASAASGALTFRAVSVPN